MQGNAKSGRKLSKPDPLSAPLQIGKQLPTFLCGEYSSTVLQRKREDVRLWKNHFRSAVEMSQKGR